MTVSLQVVTVKTRVDCHGTSEFGCGTAKKEKKVRYQKIDFYDKNPGRATKNWLLQGDKQGLAYRIASHN